ncbi:MAG: SPASM domain-containing protein [Planctomycetaceae bacterium]
MSEEQFGRVIEMAADEMRRGIFIRLKGLDDYVNGLRRGRSPVACGAGRALLLVDIHGDIWPCHRWNKGTQSTWRIGSIYEQFNEASRAILDVPDQTALLEQDCPKCIANQMCSGAVRRKS